MDSRRLAVLREAIVGARNMDELFDVERRHGPIDEHDPAAEELCYELCAACCHLSLGPAPDRARFTLLRPVPPDARRTFGVKGRIGNRIATVFWADGRLYGSLYALARLEARPADDSDPRAALERIIGAFDQVIDAPARAA
jgi:hypothetical protein